MNTIIYREIKYNSSEYKDALDLRNRVLRVPLGLCLFDADLSSEINDLHFGAFFKEKIVGVVSMVQKSSSHYQLRQFAVDPSFQKKGIGRNLLRFVENAIPNMLPVEITLHARDIAVPFYEKCGYSSLDDHFFEIGIPHTAMQKYLPVGSSDNHCLIIG